jgi:transposase
MKKEDARKLDTAAQQEKRNTAARLFKKEFEVKEIAKIAGVHYSRIYEWKRLYKQGGVEALKIKKRGRVKNTCKVLTPKQEKHIISLLIDKTPKELKFKFALWTRESVKALIDRECDMNMPISTVGNYLKQWQFTSKKPIKRAYERNDAKAKAWIEEEYPKIKSEAKAQDAAIWWADETSCVSLPNTLKGYAPKGIKPVLEHPASKFRINMISAITNTGKSMFALYDEAINAQRFIEFLQKVIDSSDKKVYMILDNLRVHHAKIVKSWIEEHQERIALFYLPAYSPDLNPDEYLNQDYKRSANSKSIPQNVKELERNTKAYMESLQNNTQKVANFFGHEAVKYAA